VGARLKFRVWIAGDIGGRIVNQSVVGSASGPSIWHGQKSRAAGVGQSGAETPEAVSWNAVLQGRGSFDCEILIATAEGSNGSEINGAAIRFSERIKETTEY
jgi:hypothetical protein